MRLIRSKASGSNPLFQTMPTDISAFGGAKNAAGFLLPRFIYGLLANAQRATARRASSFILDARIQMKWLSDRLSLPLTSEHWELYEIIHRAAWRELRDFPNLIQPRDFNDRIQWLKLFDQRQEVVQCGDKLTVRDYVREKTGTKYLTTLIQVCNSFAEIDFNSLPKAFVLKANNDSGSAVLVRDKATLHISEAKDQVERFFRSPYGWDNGEWQYSCMSPKILVEELLATDKGLPPSDYRFHCVNGQVRWVQNDIPFEPKMKEVTVDPTGRPMKIHFSSHKIYSEEFEKPAKWEEMTRLAEVLSKGWKYVRVDMFLLNNRIYAGEMTFTPYMGFYRGNGQKKLGQLLDFDRTTFREPIYKKLRRPM